MNARERAQVVGLVSRRARAVELQRDRVAMAADGDDLGVDADLCLVAVAALYRACDAASGHHQVAAALKAFNEAVPELKNGRDVMEHFERYMRNTGDLQAGGRAAERDGRSIDGKPVPGRRPLVDDDPGVWFEQASDGRCVVHVDRFAVDLDLACRAGLELAGVVLDVLT